VLLEHPDRDDPVNRAAIERLAVVRAYVESLARAAGLPDTDGISRKWLILLKGASIAACEGDLNAARSAKDVARLLLPAAADG
jgi:hypothetical protein